MRLLACAVAAMLAVSAEASGRDKAHIAVDYPEDGPIFPPEFAAPVFTWHDATTAGVAHPDLLRRRYSPFEPCFGRLRHAHRPHRPALRRRDQRTAGVDTRTGRGTYLDTGCEDVGNDQAALRQSGRGHIHHRHPARP